MNEDFGSRPLGHLAGYQGAHHVPRPYYQGPARNPSPPSQAFQRGYHHSDLLVDDFDRVDSGKPIGGLGFQDPVLAAEEANPQYQNLLESEFGHVPQGLCSPEASPHRRGLPNSYLGMQNLQPVPVNNNISGQANFHLNIHPPQTQDFDIPGARPGIGQPSRQDLGRSYIESSSSLRQPNSGSQNVEQPSFPPQDQPLSERQRQLQFGQPDRRPPLDNQPLEHVQPSQASLTPPQQAPTNIPSGAQTERYRADSGHPDWQGQSSKPDQPTFTFKEIQQLTQQAYRTKRHTSRLREFDRRKQPPTELKEPKLPWDDISLGSKNGREQEEQTNEFGGRFGQNPISVEQNAQVEVEYEQFDKSEDIDFNHPEIATLMKKRPGGKEIPHYVKKKEKKLVRVPSQPPRQERTASPVPYFARSQSRSRGAHPINPATQHRLAMQERRMSMARQAQMQQRGQPTMKISLMNQAPEPQPRQLAKSMISIDLPTQNIAHTSNPDQRVQRGGFDSSAKKQMIVIPKEAPIDTPQSEIDSQIASIASPTKSFRISLKDFGLEQQPSSERKAADSRPPVQPKSQFMRLNIEPERPAPVQQAMAKLTLNLNPGQEAAQPQPEQISSKVKISLKEDTAPRPAPSQSRKASVVAIGPSGQVSIHDVKHKTFREPTPVRPEPRISEAKEAKVKIEQPQSEDSFKIVLFDKKEEPSKPQLDSRRVSIAIKDPYPSSGVFTIPMAPPKQEMPPPPPPQPKKEPYSIIKAQAAPLQKQVPKPEAKIQIPIPHPAKPAPRRVEESRNLDQQQENLIQGDTIDGMMDERMSFLQDDQPMSDSDDFNSTKAVFHCKVSVEGDQETKYVIDSSQVSMPSQSPPKIGGNSGISGLPPKDKTPEPAPRPQQAQQPPPAAQRQPRMSITLSTAPVATAQEEKKVDDKFQIPNQPAESFKAPSEKLSEAGNTGRIVLQMKSQPAPAPAPQPQASIDTQSEVHSKSGPYKVSLDFGRDSQLPKKRQSSRIQINFGSTPNPPEEQAQSKADPEFAIPISIASNPRKPSHRKPSVSHDMKSVGGGAGFDAPLEKQRYAEDKNIILQEGSKNYNNKINYNNQTMQAVKPPYRDDLDKRNFVVVGNHQQELQATRPNKFDAQQAFEQKPDARMYHREGPVNEAREQIPPQGLGLPHQLQHQVEKAIQLARMKKLGSPAQIESPHSRGVSAQPPVTQQEQHIEVQPQDVVRPERASSHFIRGGQPQPGPAFEKPPKRPAEGGDPKGRMGGQKKRDPSEKYFFNIYSQDLIFIMPGAGDGKSGEQQKFVFPQQPGAPPIDPSQLSQMGIPIPRSMASNQGSSGNQPAPSVQVRQEGEQSNDDAWMDASHHADANEDTLMGTCQGINCSLDSRPQHEKPRVPLAPQEYSLHPGAGYPEVPGNAYLKLKEPAESQQRILSTRYDEMQATQPALPRNQAPPQQPSLPMVLHKDPEELKTGEMTHGVESLVQGTSPLQMTQIQKKGRRGRKQPNDEQASQVDADGKKTRRRRKQGEESAQPKRGRKGRKPAEEPEPSVVDAPIQQSAQAPANQAPAQGQDVVNQLVEKMKDYFANTSHSKDQQLDPTQQSAILALIQQTIQTSATPAAPTEKIPEPPQAVNPLQQQKPVEAPQAKKWKRTANVVHTYWPQQDGTLVEHRPQQAHLQVPQPSAAAPMISDSESARKEQLQSHFLSKPIEPSRRNTREDPSSLAISSFHSPDNSAENKRPMNLGKAPHRIPPPQQQPPAEASVKISLEPKEESSLISFTLPPAKKDEIEQELASPYKQQRGNQQAQICLPKESPSKMSVTGSKFKIQLLSPKDKAECESNNASEISNGLKKREQKVEMKQSTKICLQYSSEISEQRPVRPEESKRTGTRVRYNQFGVLPNDDDHQLVQCPKYHSFDQQPYRIFFTFEVMVLMQIHAYLSKNEVIGLLGGKVYDSKLSLKTSPSQKCKVVIINKIYPAESCVQNPSSRLKNCEISPMEQARIQEQMDKDGVQKVSWYHSHPQFEVDPSVRDLETHYSQQVNFDMQGMPFFGVIIGPYSSNQDVLTTNLNVFNLCEGGSGRQASLQSRARAYHSKIIPRSKLNYKIYDEIKHMIKYASQHGHDRPGLDTLWQSKLSNAQRYTKHEKLIYSLKAICDQNYDLQSTFSVDQEIKRWLQNEADVSQTDLQIHSGDLAVPPFFECRVRHGQEESCNESEKGVVYCDSASQCTKQAKKIFSISDNKKIIKFLFKIEAQIIKSFDLTTPNIMGSLRQQARPAPPQERRQEHTDPNFESLMLLMDLQTVHREPGSLDNSSEGQQ